MLGGETSGWTGQAPADISGTVNPTFVLQPGATHVLVWTNLDGKKHDLVVADANGTKLRATGSSADRGATRSVTLRATPKMAQYYCSYHPQSMRGALRAGEGTETTTSTP